MMDTQNSGSGAVGPHRRFRFMPLATVALLIAFVCVLSGCSVSASSPANAATSAQASSSTTPTSYAVKVFFSKYPNSLQTDFAAVYPVDRVSPTIAVGTFAIQLLIAGPTLEEQRAGYFTEVNSILSGPSNCTGSRPVGGPDFVLTLNMRGTTPQAGTASLKFCRTLASGGIGTDARVQAEINATLKQFTNIKQVVILTKDGHCFADARGNDGCLHS